MRHATWVLAFLLMGCADDPATPSAQLALRVDQSQYVIGQEVKLTLINGSSEDVYVDFQCGSLLQGRRDGRWVEVYSYFCRVSRTLAPDVFLYLIEAGGSFSDRLTVRMLTPHEPGGFERFRLVTMVKSEPRVADRRPVASPPFEIQPR